MTAELVLACREDKDAARRVAFSYQGHEALFDENRLVSLAGMLLPGI